MEQLELSADQWQDSQKNELWFWQTMLDQGNPDQKHRNMYYQGNMEGKCSVIYDYIIGHDISKRVIVDLGSGPEGFCHAIPGRVRIAVDPLMNRFRQMGFAVDSNGVVSINARAEQLSTLFQNNIDIIFCLNSIDHHQAPEIVMDNIFDALRPGGQAFILTDLRPVELLDAYHKLPLSREAMEAWAVKFDIIKVQEFPHGPGNPLMQLMMHLQVPQN